MLSNYLLLTWRNLTRNKTSALINIGGLALGMAAAIFIFEYVLFEESFDTQVSDLDHKYRVYNDRYQNGELIQHGTITYPMISPALASEFPEVTSYTRIFPQFQTPIIWEEEVYMEPEVLVADAHFLDFFSIEVLAGDPQTALLEYNSVAISMPIAKKYFGLEEDQAEEAIGKILEVTNDRNPCKITAVYRPLPVNSHLRPDLLISYETLIIDAGENERGEKYADLSRQWSDFYHYIQLDPGTSQEAFQAKLAGFGQTYFGEGEFSGSVETFFLQPLSEAYLFSDFEYEIGRTNNGKAIRALMGIGLFILFIAWINYINLTTARALDRAKEVGVRKVMGARKSQLVRQFLVESLVFNISGLLLAITIVQLLQPLLNQWLMKPLSITQLFAANPLFTPIIILTWLTGVIASGLYPAWHLSGFKPVAVLKGKLTRNHKGAILRKGLVVFQFACSLLLILATYSVYKQLMFMQKQSLGIDIEQKLVVNGPMMTPYDSTFIQRVQTLKNEWKKIPQVQKVSASRHMAGDRLPRLFNATSDVRGPENTVMLNRMNIDFDFIDVYGLNVLHGRPFRRGDHKINGADVRTLLLNESAAELLGYPNSKELVNKEVTMSNSSWEVVSIIEDFHQRSLRYPIEPIVFLPYYSTYDSYTLSLVPGAPEQSLDQIKHTYASIFPGNNFSYYFVDDRFQEQYMEDQRFSQLFALFAILTILIACLGLFGLSSYNMKQRTKEIGIRKVLGAHLYQLLLLLSREYAFLILIAGLVAAPLAFLFLSSWLSTYAYRIPYSMGMFLLPIACLFIIALVTVSAQTLHTAKANPVEALRTE